MALALLAIGAGLAGQVLGLELLEVVAVGMLVLALAVLWFGRKLSWGGYFSPRDTEKVTEEIIARVGKQEGRELVSEAVSEYRIKLKPPRKRPVKSATDFVREVNRATGNVATVLDELEKSDLLKLWENLDNPLSQPPFA